MNLLIPFGLRNSRMWRPDQVSSGLGCGCVCPACDGRLVAKNNGSKRRPHFSHYVVGMCNGAFESSVHRMAKQLICDSAELTLPHWSGTKEMPNPPTARDSRGNVHSGDRVEFSAAATVIHSARPEQAVGNVRPDVLMMDADGQLLIEVRVRHAVGPQKALAVRSAGLRMIEIDLSKVSLDEALDQNYFFHLVLHERNNRTWISCPSAETSWRISSDELAKKIAALDQQHGPNLDSETPVFNRVRSLTTPARVQHRSLGSFQTAEPGQRLWHSGRGVGTIVGRAMTSTPVYQVDFEQCGLRTIVLEPSGRNRTWRLIDDTS